MEEGFPLRLPAIEVHQPLGLFYVFKLDAATLLKLTFADPLRVTSEAFSDEEIPMSGAQRAENRRRLKDIAGFLETTEAAFPNSIILGANYTKDGKFIRSEKFRWKILEGDDGCLTLEIPTTRPLASVIDGQHRLNAFYWVREDLRHSTELLCAVYLDLPNPYQASLFATINFNQKKVDRSLAYLLFGMSLEDETPEAWAPDKTAVFLTRKLNLDVNSPLHQNIIVAAQQSEILFANKIADWAVSTATIVDGILRLISANPNADKKTMYRERIGEGRSRTVLDSDGTPLRNLYLRTNDAATHEILVNFFSAVRRNFWTGQHKSEAMTKTVALQALFDVLGNMLAEMREQNIKEFSESYFFKRLAPAKEIPFDKVFESSSRGRASIRNLIELKLDLRRLPSLVKTKDFPAYHAFAVKEHLPAIDEAIAKWEEWTGLDWSADDD